MNEAKWQLIETIERGCQAVQVTTEIMLEATAATGALEFGTTPG